MPRQVVLDTNLALLLIVGLTNRNYIAKHGRLAAYRVDDYDLLSLLIESYAGIVFCPNVLTETSNLLGQIKEPIRRELYETFATVVELPAVVEKYVGSRDVVRDRPFQRLGLTDAVLLTLSESDGVLLTADLALYLEAKRAGRDAFNYNHIRDQMY